MSTQITNPPISQYPSDSINGRNPTASAVPMNGNSALHDHKRTPSMTVTPAGTTTSYNPNGPPQNKANVQFGSLNNGGNINSSPAMSTPQPVHTQSNSLGVNNLAPRLPSPSSSPSPIPQPVQVSGGRPPSELSGPGKHMSFGQFGGDGSDVNGVTRGISQMQMGEQHNRRGSQQSMHANSSHEVPSGPGRGGYSNRGGRGGYGNQYGGHMPFNPNSNFRPNNSRGNYQGRGGHSIPYQGSPSMQHRQPMNNMTPGGTPQMAAMQMNPATMAPYGYTQYPVNIPNSRSISEAVRGKPSRGTGRGGKGKKFFKANGKPAVPSMDPASDNYVGPGASDAIAASHRVYSLPVMPAFPLPDLSPESGNFENFLTQSAQAAYGQVPIAADPSISYNAYQQQQFYPQQYAGYPPQSPRPPFNQPGFGGQQMQSTYSNQGHMPQPMSRQSSQMSTADQRPGSSIGQTPQTPAAALHHTSTRTPSISGEKSSFIQPQKKSAAIVIKNAQGEVVDFSKKTPSAPAPAPAPATIPAITTPTLPTPPSRTGSAVSAAHGRTDSQSVKPDDKDEKKKAMQEAIAKKIAQDKEEEAEKLRKQKEAEEQKAQMEAEAAAAAEREAAEKKAEAERLEQEAKEAEERIQAAEAEKAAKAKAEEEEKAKAAAEPAVSDEDAEFERMVAEMEREQAEKEAEEARKEEEYQKKKAADKAAQAKKEQDEAAAYEATMKEAERRAEEEEIAREKKRAEGSQTDDESKKLFAQLKGDEAGDSTEESPAATPGESGAATPLSDLSMGPPAKALGSLRRGKPSELTLNTKASTEPPEPSATLKSLTTARKLEDPTNVSYPSGIVSPNPALNANAPADRKFKYNKEFLLQFQNVFKEKPSLDWDQKIQAALGHDDSARPQTARTPSGMGGRSASHRGAAAGNFGGPMGTFGGGPTRTLPPGTTSEQRFAASSGGSMRGGPMANNPFAFGRPGSMGPPMARTPSNNPLGVLPGSPRVGGASRGGSRAESKRNNKSAKQEADANKSMPLTAGLNVTNLEVSATGWKPRSLGPSSQASVGLDGYMEADVVQRKVKAALNKMTPEKFDRISDGVLEIAAQSKQETDGRTLRQVIQLVFEKATDEAHWAPMYAKFCFKMLSTMSADIKDETIKDKNGNVVAGGNLFRKYLLNRCQEEFEKGWKINLPTTKEGETEEAVMLSDEYYIAAAAKRRGLGLVKFIGELFKLGMLTERIMHECVKKLLDYDGTPEEAEVESLSSLLKTIGKQLDMSESKAAGRMDAYFERINQTLTLPDLPSRLRFMLMDVVDLRRNGWNSKDADKGPKTIQQIHEEAEAAQQAAEMSRLASQAAGRGGGRLPMGRGDVRSFSHGGPMPPPDNSNRIQAEDLRRLGGRSQRQNTTTPSGSFGPSALGARTNSRRGLGPNIASAGTSRTGTPPAQTDSKKDDSSTNAFSALAALEGAEGPASPPSNPSSPPIQKSQPTTNDRSRSPEKKAD
ncbi:hypothetical protein LTS08_003113 [Lithohypha guttulata]|uniref:MIF4G domain-containing protein n=1 Tax=Lithohypha guttulata TaxID=1690604 RepID=A0AAN7T015_9EURO|nr:hypothetical protein LTR05_004708 [Lithohypha guttulata]KAK5103695.1 hypothetical protein LTS08_003113 [Lithohypha guttulata]